MNSNQFDVIIVGAGPAGIISAMQLAKLDLSVCLLEKEKFPRDKTCGDALSVDVLNQFEMIDTNLAKRFEKFTNKTPSYGVKIVAPNQQFLDIPFYYKGKKKFGYISKRIDFDNFLFEELKQFKNITIVENCKVLDVVVSDESVSVEVKLLQRDSQRNTEIHREKLGDSATLRETELLHKDSQRNTEIHREKLGDSATLRETELLHKDSQRNTEIHKEKLGDSATLRETELLHKDSQRNTEIHREKNLRKSAKSAGNKFTSKIVLGADGAHSIVNKKTIKNKVEHNHYSAGLRVYYKNVTNFHEENFIELHFFKDVLPGYLWIFPLPNNEANIGIGMLSSYVSKKKVNLKKVLANLIENHPNLKERFKNATALETMKGFSLPLGSKKRKISSNRVLLLGDAAGLIDPFSGEGIANAIRSGRVAAKHLKKCFELNDFSKVQNLKYEKEIYRLMSKEFKVSRTLQNLCKHPRLFNFVVNKANKNDALRDFLIGTLEDVEKKKLLTKPSFYYRLFFK